MLPYCISFLFVACICGATNLSATPPSQSYLREAPSFLQPCRLRDSRNSDCLGRMLERILHYWRYGVPGLRNSGTLEPFREPKVLVTQNAPGVIVQIEQTNMVTHGMSFTKVLNSNTLINGREYTIALHVRMPRILVESLYNLKGRILLLNLNSMGNLSLQMKNLELVMTFKVQPYQAHGLTFAKLISLKTEVPHIENAHVYLTNLFNGNKPLERSANEVLNQNWRLLFELMRPVLTRTYDEAIMGRLVKVFAYVPAQYLFSDFK